MQRLVVKREASSKAPIPKLSLTQTYRKKEHPTEAVVFTAIQKKAHHDTLTTIVRRSRPSSFAFRAEALDILDRAQRT